MSSYFFAVYLFFSLLFLSGCQTISNTSRPVSASNNSAFFLPLATAVQVSYQDEVNLLRLNQILAEQKGLGIKEQARLFYERALIYDRMGLGAHSRYDLSQSIGIDPTFAPAYNILGLYLLLNQSYDDAFEAFDSALELSDKMEYSYLHRAIGLYQIGRYSLASEDIEKFYRFDIHDPYRVLWRYIINSKLDKQQALTELQTAKQLERDNRFAWSLVDIMSGRITEQQFFDVVSHGVYTNQELAQRLCETYFYLGYWHKLSGNLNRAIYYFKLTTATNIHDFVEYKYALMELASIQLALKIE